MTLYEIIQVLKDACRKIPNVGVVEEGSIYEYLNAKQDVAYSAMILTQQQHQVNVDKDITTYRFIIYYVDRLLDDKSNKVEIQSTGIEAIKSVLRDAYDAGLIIDNYVIDTFTNSFNDITAGAYATLGIESIDDGLCD